MRDTTTGLKLEQEIADRISILGYEVISHTNWKKTNRTGKYLIKNFPYSSIYDGHTGKTEFVMQDNDRKIRIECKWQEVNGSADEKFPYVYLNALFNWQEEEIIIVVEGNGYKKGAKEWIRKVVDGKLFHPENCSKVIRVMNLQEFDDWISKGLQRLTYEVPAE